MTADARALVRRYYDALDDQEYEALEAVLAPAFVQRRPDRSFENRDAFIRFMREGRPNPDTRHEITAIVADEGRAAACGRVVDTAADRSLFEFADFFDIEGDRIVRIETYSR
ncbi:nuclear transport factor 2 family protein [Halosolutus gelatinilyticus]|uniref:nuclear transport factor 2 family protein n=1 Tax=Halosolutus gelatinilyticus TaxID=2931975 RepID=UPI001FF5E713|nr:nuclear transport factor 2 family protein [Halosolutus gelatinilyticus]